MQENVEESRLDPASGDAPLPWWIRSIHILSLILVVSLVFSNTLENTYHLDSIYRVKNNTEINEFFPPSRFFTDVRTGSTISQIAEYRPMMPLSHALGNEIVDALGGNRLVGYHVGNIAIHIGSAILVYSLFSLLIANWGGASGRQEQAVHYNHVAFAAALIFAVHPIAGSAVNYIAARDLLLMVFFFLASVLVYVHMRRQGDSLAGWVAALLLLCLAILSKQAAITAFGLIFLFEWILNDAKLTDWRLWARTALFSLPTVAYFLLRSLWLVKDSPAAGLRLPVDNWFPLTMAKAHLFYYLRNFACPFEMRALARFDIVDGFTDPGMLIGAVFILGTLALAWYLRKRVPLVAFAILAYWLLIALTSSIFPFQYVVTDYRQYLSFSFLCLIVSVLLFKLKPRLGPVLILAGLALYFSLASYRINQHWRTEESFWGQSVRYGAVAMAHMNYGLAVSKKDNELAEKHYLEALRQQPNNVYANINLGLLYVNHGKPDEGVAKLRATVALSPTWALSHYWLSKGLAVVGENEESLVELIRAADLDPRRLSYQYEAAKALGESGDRQASILYLERVRSINPNYRKTGFLLGFAYQKSGDNEGAIAEYQRFLEHQPKQVQARFNLAYALMVEGRCTAAVDHFNRVLELRPKYREVHLHLSSCYASMGNEAAAEKHRKTYEG